MRACGSDLFCRRLAAPVVESYERNEPFCHLPSNSYCQLIRVGTYSSSSAINRISWPRESYVRAATMDPKTWIARLGLSRALEAATKSREVQAPYSRVRDV